MQSTDAYRLMQKKLRRKSTRNRVVRYGLLGFNAILLFGVLAFVFVNQQSSGATDKKLLVATSGSEAAANPLDQISSIDIAVNVARMSALPEATAVVNLADSMSAESAIAPASTSIVSKPQVVTTVLKSKKDIKTYIAVAGDTVASIATKFNVTADSVKWSNNLTGNQVSAGQTLVLPPEGVSGIVYTVKAGDTPENLAAKYRANRDEIIAYNDAEIAGLKVGERIIIANATIAAPAPVRAAATASYAWGSAPIYGYNGYTFGYCTWYVANRIAVPANWGNANTWDNRAPMSGWSMSKIPRVGSIGQSNRGSEGHVAVVDAVSPDGTMIKYSDMNGLAGWGRVGVSDWVSASKFENYIYQ